MKYLIRNKDYKKNAPTKDAKKIYLICEGSVTESSYFGYFISFSGNLEIVPIKSQNGETDPVKLMERAKILFFGDKDKGLKCEYELKSEYGDTVWFVIDTDRWNEGDKINRLKEFCAENNSQDHMWFVAQSNPSFEQWLYFHFFANKPNEDNVKEYSTFKEYVGNQISGGFDCRKHPINIDIAVTNSRHCFEMNDTQPAIYSTELHKLGAVICELIHEDLQLAKKIASAAAARVSKG